MNGMVTFSPMVELKIWSALGLGSGITGIVGSVLLLTQQNGILLTGDNVWVPFATVLSFLGVAIFSTVKATRLIDGIRDDILRANHRLERIEAVLIKVAGDSFRTLKENSDE